jgi:hypothetical protein
MAFSIRNIEKFIDDHPELVANKKALMKKARKLVEKDGVTMVAISAKMVLGRAWSEIFFKTIESDFDHIKIGLEDFLPKKGEKKK